MPDAETIGRYRVSFRTSEGRAEHVESAGRHDGGGARVPEMRGVHMARQPRAATLLLAVGFAVLAATGVLRGQQAGRRDGRPFLRRGETGSASAAASISST